MLSYRDIISEIRSPSSAVVSSFGVKKRDISALQKKSSFGSADANWINLNTSFSA
jgi:hypothetical protein